MIYARLYAFAFMACLAASTTFLLLASYFGPQVQAYLGETWSLFGVLDVLLAFFTVVLWILLRRERAPRLQNYEQAVMASASLIAILFVGAWLTLESADNSILLPGLAWRSFVLVAASPSVLAQIYIVSDALRAEEVI